MGCGSVKDEPAPAAAPQPVQPVGPPPTPLGETSKYYFKVIFQHPDYRIEEIVAKEVSKEEANAWRKAHGVTDDGQCKKPELLNTSSDKPSEVMASWAALLEPNTKATDAYPKLKNGAFMRLIEGSYIPLKAPADQRQKAIAILTTLIEKAQEAYSVGHDKNEVKTGLTGNWQYLITTLEDGVFEKGHTYVALSIRYHRV